MLLLRLPRRRESQGLCREDVVCTVDEVRKSCKSQQLSLHVYTEVSVRMMMMKLVDEMINDVMRLTRTRGIPLLSDDEGGDMSEISQMGDDDVFVKVSGTVSVSGVSAQPGDDDQGGKTVPDSKILKVRPKYSSLKKCVRSKLNRCLTHRCQFEEVEQERRILVGGMMGR